MKQMNIIKRLTAALLFAAFLLPLWAQEQPDSVFEFRFVPQNNMFFSPYKGNDAELGRLLAFVDYHREAIAAGSLPLYVDGYCNSASSQRACLATAKVRSNRVKSELITRKELAEKHFVTANHATEGDFVTVRIILPKTNVSVTDDKRHVNEQETIAPDTENDKVTEQVQETEAVQTEETTSSEAMPASATPDKSHFSLRGNLLRWATLTPDLGIEWRINPSWGLLVNGSWTSWSWDSKNRRYALWEVNPEVRYYMGKTRRGYIGAMYKVGSFNYKLSDTGKQGDLMGGGITGGYVLRLNKALNIDFTLGLGYVRADCDKYVVTDGVRVRQGKESKNWWGPVSAGVTLVWTLF